MMLYEARIGDYTSFDFYASQPLHDALNEQVFSGAGGIVAEIDRDPWRSILELAEYVDDARSQEGHCLMVRPDLPTAELKLSGQPLAAGLSLRRLIEGACIVDFTYYTFPDLPPEKMTTAEYEEFVLRSLLGARQHTTHTLAGRGPATLL